MGYFERQVAVVDRDAAFRPAGSSFWRKDEPDFNPDGTRIARGGMWSHQRQWWELKNFIKLLVGGYGSGKTSVLCKRGISVALTNAPVPYALVSPTFSIARQTTIQTTTEMLEGKRRLLGARALWWNYNKSSHEFTIRYHGRVARIIVYSGDNPLSLRGPNLCGAGIDEPFIQEQAVFDQMLARVRHPDAVFKEIVLTGTPEELNWGYELAEGELRAKHDVGIVTASTMDNRALDDAYAQRLLSAYDEAAADAYVRGRFVNLSKGRVYYAFDPMEHVVSRGIPAGAELGVGMDFNVDPMSAVVFWRKDDQIHFFHEVELPNADTEYMCDYLKEKFPSLVYVYPDASGKNRSTAAQGKSDYYWIRQAGFRIKSYSQNPHRRDRYNAVNGKLKPAMGGGQLTMTFDPACAKLKTYLLQYTHERMNKQKEMSHLLDAMSYPVAYLYPVTKNRFAAKKLKGF